MPPAAQQLLALMNDDDAPVARVTQIIEQDPALSARILGLANSAYYGRRDRIYKISDAITKVLGLRVVYAQAMSIVLAAPFQAGRCLGFQPQRYWFSATACAHLAQRLAPACEPPVAADAAHLCGLLHNLGLLALVHTTPEDMARVFVRAEAEPETGTAAFAAELVGITHQQAGRLLAARWHLPEPVGTVLMHYGERDYRGEHWRLVVLIIACAQLAQKMFAREAASIANDDTLAALGLDAERAAARLGDFDELIESLHALASQMAE